MSDGVLAGRYKHRRWCCSSIGEVPRYQVCTDWYMYVLDWLCTKGSIGVWYVVASRKAPWNVVILVGYQNLKRRKQQSMGMHDGSPSSVASRLLLPWILVAALRLANR